MTTQEKVEAILAEYDIEEIIGEHKADTTPFFEFAFEALGTMKTEEREHFMALLDESIVHYGIDGELVPQVKDTAAFILLVLTGLEGFSLKDLINSAPGYVLFRAISLFIDGFDPEDKDTFDPTMILRWNLLLRTMYLHHAEADPATDIAEPFLHASLSCCWIWYSVENWDALESLGGDTLSFAEQYAEKFEGNITCTVSTAVLHYLIGTAMAEGRKDENSMKEHYGKALEIIGSLPVEVQNEMAEIKNACVKALGEL